MSLPYDYYPLVLKVLDLLSQGHTLTNACDENNIRISIFEQYVESDVRLQTMLDEAVRRGNDALADALITIDNHKIHGQSDSKMAGVISKNIMWVLSKRDARFRDKVEITHTLKADKAITDALAAGKRRAIEGKIIDLVPQVVTEDDLIMSPLLEGVPA